VTFTFTGNVEMPRQQYLVFRLFHAVALEWPVQFALPTVCRDTCVKQKSSCGCLVLLSDVLGVVVSVAWHPVTLDFGNMQKR
jgi:hypothetical protein